MRVWVIETVEDHEAGYLLGVTATAAQAVAFLREQHRAETDPQWHEPRGEDGQPGAVRVTPVDELPDGVDDFVVYRGKGWNLSIWAVTRFDVMGA